MVSERITFSSHSFLRHVIPLFDSMTRPRKNQISIARIDHRRRLRSFFPLRTGTKNANYRFSNLIFVSPTIFSQSLKWDSYVPLSTFGQNSSISFTNCEENSQGSTLQIRQIIRHEIGTLGRAQFHRKAKIPPTYLRLFQEKTFKRRMEGSD